MFSSLTILYTLPALAMAAGEFTMSLAQDKGNAKYTANIASVTAGATVYNVYCISDDCAPAANFQYTSFGPSSYAFNYARSSVGLTTQATWNCFGPAPKTGFCSYTSTLYNNGALQQKTTIAGRDYAIATYTVSVGDGGSAGTAVSGTAATGTSNVVAQSGKPGSSGQSFGTTMVVSGSENAGTTSTSSSSSSSTSSSSSSTSTGSSSGAGRNSAGALLGVALLAAAL
jgi:hypothetical protein